MVGWSRRGRGGGGGARGGASSRHGFSSRRSPPAVPQRERRCAGNAAAAAAGVRTGWQRRCRAAAEARQYSRCRSVSRPPDGRCCHGRARSPTAPATARPSAQAPRRRRGSIRGLAAAHRVGLVRSRPLAAGVGHVAAAGRALCEAAPFRPSVGGAAAARAGGVRPAAPYGRVVGVAAAPPGRRAGRARLSGGRRVSPPPWLDAA